VNGEELNWLLQTIKDSTTAAAQYERGRIFFQAMNPCGSRTISDQPQSKNQFFSMLSVT